MASEITYAELNFKNASPNAPPAAVAEVPPEVKKHEHHPQKYPPWLPWLTSLLLLSVCIALVVLLVAPSLHSGDRHTALQRNFTECQCFLAVLQGKDRGWMCCQKGWKLFQKSCYYLSADRMPWTESMQNCTGMGSHLVVINSREEQSFLYEELQPSSRRLNYYIGLHAQKVGKWQWVDQTPFDEKAAFWREGEPSNVNIEKCVVIHTNSEIHNWNDARCESHYRICEAAALILVEQPSS